MNSISFANYKAFDSGQITLKPLTILLGANSSGKSSILQLFLMLEQTINSEDNERFLKLNGHYVNLGEDENIFKDKNPNKILEVSFNLNFKEFVDGFYESFLDLLQRIDFNSYLLSLDIHNELSATIRELIRKDADEFSKYFNSTVLKVHELLIGNQDRIKGNWNDDMEIMYSSFLLFSEVKAIIENPKYNTLRVKYDFRLDKEKILRVYNHSIYLGDKVLLRFSIDKKPSFGSELFQFNNFNDLVHKLENFDFSYDGIRLKSFRKGILRDIFSQMFNLTYNQIAAFFSSSQFNYIGPLRANPQRYYFLDGSDGYNLKSGEGIANVLKKYPELKWKVNKWLTSFGISIDVSVFKDIIHNIKVYQNNIRLDLTDVGFGISQILPILIQGFLSSTDSTTIIEQPEIHLHPKMQADLADLFIDIIDHSRDENSIIKKNFIIETHSVYMLKRLRRRIAEGVIKSSDVGLYFVESRSQEKDSAELRAIDIDADGSIEWPKDFYSTEFEDDMAFLSCKAKLK